MSIAVEEREIDLIDMIADILSHWRGIIICMLAGALLMGAFSYVKSFPREEEAPAVEVPAEALLLLEERLKESEKLEVAEVLIRERQLEWYEEYAENSVLMQMDPYHIPAIDLIFTIQANDMRQDNILGSVYEDMVNSVGMYAWVEEQTGIPIASAGDLISVWKKSNMSVSNGEQETEPVAGSLRVRVIHCDEAMCEKLAQSIKDYIKRKHAQLVQELGNHEVTLLSESAGEVMDMGVRDEQIFCSDTRIALLKNNAIAKEAFTEDERLYYNLLTGEGSEDNTILKPGNDSADEATAAKPSVSRKYVLLGAVLFAFVYAGIFFVVYVLNGKLRTVDELQRLYHISQLGLVVRDDGKKKLFIDKRIDALRNRNKRQFTAEQSLQLAATAVKISAGKQGLDTVYLMGCDLKVGAEAVCRKLKEMLEQENIAVVILDNVLYDAAAMDELEHAKGIVLVEKAMSTMYDEISRELELASRQGIQVLGGIIVE